MSHVQFVHGKIQTSKIWLANKLQSSLLKLTMACWLERLFECKVMVIYSSMSTNEVYTIVITPRAIFTLRDTENLGMSYRTNRLIVERVTTRK